MYQIWNTLNDNIKSSLEKTNLKEIFEVLSSIEESIVSSGVGGSYPVAIFAKKVLKKKNNIEVTTMELLEILQTKERIKNLLLISHSGKNYGIKEY